MGLNIGNIVEKKGISFADLKGKTLCVDAMNTIYQFLTTIRQPDGTPLMDKKGRVTSHLSGLFYRNLNLLQDGIKLIYCFDGKPPALKFRTSLARREAKEEAMAKYEEAKEKGDIGAMRLYAQQTTKMTKEVIEESKELLEAMGIAVVQAPSEGEAQAAEIVKEGKAYAVASQDYDALLFGAPILIQNLTLARKKRTVSGFIQINPMLIELKELLKTLGINHEQLICIGILAGSDFNPGGVHGIGQKKALKLVQEHKTPEKIFEAVQEEVEEAGFDWREVYKIFEHHEVLKDVKITFPKFDAGKIKKILIEHDFSEERIESGLAKLGEAKAKQGQKMLF